MTVYYRGIPKRSNIKETPNSIIWVTDNPDYASEYGIVYDLDIDDSNCASSSDVYDIAYEYGYTEDSELMDIVEDKDVQQELLENGYTMADAGESASGDYIYIILDSSVIKSTTLHKESFGNIQETKKYINQLFENAGIRLCESQEEWYWTNGTIEDYMDEYNLYWILNEKFNTHNNSIWFPVIDGEKYRQALIDFVKNGELLRFPSKYIYDWANIIMRNSAIFNNIASLYGESPNGYIPFQEVYDTFVGEYDEEEAREYIDNLASRNITVKVKWLNKPIIVDDEFSAMVYILQENGVYDFLRMPDGSYDVWSDMQGFWGIGNFDDCGTVEEALVLINKYFDVWHHRSDLSSLFITGGKKTLTSISNETRSL